MNRKEILEAFARLSAEDQALVRNELMEKTASKEECCSPAMMEQLQGMMKKMEASKDPMAMCMSMMQMCHEKMAGGSASSGA